MNVLVVGGAGYIGSHCVRQLQAAGHKAVVMDSLVYGHRKAVSPETPFYDCDMADRPALLEILKKEQIELVMHFAAFAYVGESMSDPLKYYDNNVAKPLSLLQTMREAGVTKFVFSSSCTVLGEEAEPPFTEAMPLRPISAYGQTKADVEVILEYCAKAYGMSAAIFRYFNASGANEAGDIGEDHDPETHLIPIAIQCALGQRKQMYVFGDDYPTPDGTCLRDYVHVDDLSRAHIAAFPKLEEEGVLLKYNLGTGTPASVLEIIKTVEDVSGLPVPYELGPRRSGDVPAAYADSKKAKEELGWEPQYPTIRSIIETAWKWHKAHPKGYDDRD
ncbi:UDP-glucose 4-epimerase GalE [Pelagicoccus sp. SDUM812003]|uniref:UDP-glucose 4-epimerase GalE n=1 Tax=Pelagicoccus sp. SDUM812003 TaxID=3041267 RepID=UPI00280DE8E1|nr:UDP-glucose 4-epimerase GalE [Pelagicoccus sp. SDUM812003]MDQ8201562.1 UDP-glucose 4-epimerase GalE [Pelagicoccus sp. SDUM812003]